MVGYSLDSAYTGGHCALMRGTTMRLSCPANSGANIAVFWKYGTLHSWVETDASMHFNV